MKNIASILVTLLTTIPLNGIALAKTIACLHMESSMVKQTWNFTAVETIISLGSKVFTSNLNNILIIWLFI